VRGGGGGRPQEVAQAQWHVAPAGAATARLHPVDEIADPDDPNRYVAVRGTVVDITEEGADAHLDRLARRYLGRDRYPDSYRFPGELRRIYRIAPDKVTTWDPFG